MAGGLAVGVLVTSEQVTGRTSSRGRCGHQVAWGRWADGTGKAGSGGVGQMGLNTGCMSDFAWRDSAHSGLMATGRYGMEGAIVPT